MGGRTVNARTVAVISPVKWAIAKIILLVVAACAFSALNYNYRPLVNPLVLPLGLLALVITLDKGFGRTIAELKEIRGEVKAAEEMARTAAREIIYLRGELESRSQTDAKAAGFQMPDATAKAVGKKSDEDEE
jgi:hypothetical protein